MPRIRPRQPSPDIVEIPDPQDIAIIIDRMAPKYPSLAKRISTTFVDTCLRGLSYFATSNFLSPNRFLQSIVYHLIPSECLARIFSLNPTCCSSFHELLLSANELCPQQTIVEAFTDKEVVTRIVSVLSSSGFKAAVLCDAIWRGVFNALIGKKSKIADLLTISMSSLLILLYASNVLSRSSGRENPTKELESFYTANDFELGFVANAAWNFGSFAFYKGLDYVSSKLIKCFSK
jgi:hypothetical protein